MEPIFAVRPLSPSDAEAYFALRLEMMLDTPHSFLASPGDDSATDVEGFRERLGRGAENITFGAFSTVDGDKLALVGSDGIVRMKRQKAAHTAIVWGVYVQPASRRRGLGRRLMGVAIAHARELDGVTHVKLGVSADASGAQALYESVGFKAWGTEPNAMIVDGKYRDEVHMVLALDRE